MGDDGDLRMDAVDRENALRCLISKRALPFSKIAGCKSLARIRHRAIPANESKVMGGGDAVGDKGVGEEVLNMACKGVQVIALPVQSLNVRAAQ